jgi:uncharacterized protein YbjQ (UPF0145 family)
MGEDNDYMEKCCVCGKKMGMFEASPLGIFNKSLSSYYVCGKCAVKVKSLEQGHSDFMDEFEEIIAKTDDDTLKKHLISLCEKIDSEELERKRREEEKKRQEKIVQEKEVELKRKIREIINGILLTTGYNFEGYKIIQYKDIISGECVLGTGFLSELTASLSDFAGTQSAQFSNKLKVAKGQALTRLRESCYLQSGNAIIGIDFDYVTFANNMVGVIATGTAVVIEKLD